MKTFCFDPYHYFTYNFDEYYFYTNVMTSKYLIFWGKIVNTALLF